MINDNQNMEPDSFGWGCVMIAFILALIFYSLIF